MARHLTVLLISVVILVQAHQAQASVVAPAGNCYSQTGCTDYARSTTDLASSVGVNTHLGYSDTVYWQKWPLIRQRLIELGVSHIRDGTFAAGYPGIIGPGVAARYNELNAAGIKGNLLVGLEQAGLTTLAQRLNWIKTNVADFTTSIEGSNESTDDATAIRNMQCDIFNRVRADAVLRPKPVIGPSAGAPFSQTTWYDRVGDLNACVDKGSLHPYPGADPPHRTQNRDLSAAMGWAEKTYGTKPQWVTETGYWNTSDPDGVSDRAAGTYIPRAFMENFRRGIERTQGYELIDGASGNDRVIDNYGLLRTDGSPKPAFTALKNLLAIVKDSGTASGSLGFGIVCESNCKAGNPDAFPTQDGPIRHVLLRGSTGAFYLAVWSESKVWQAETRTDTPKPAQGFKLYLRDAPAKVEMFDPATGQAPISTDTSGAKVVTTVAPDRIRLIKITPAAAAPAASRKLKGRRVAVREAIASVLGSATSSAQARRSRRCRRAARVRPSVHRAARRARTRSTRGHGQASRASARRKPAKPARTCTRPRKR